jgi:hypothetical protein
MNRTPIAGSQMRSKRRIYVIATLVSMAILLPYQHDAWAPYVAACVGYTVLVFGLNRLEFAPTPAIFTFPASGARVHGIYLCVVLLWVWFLIALSPHLPYILRTEDTTHPYFGVAFIGVLGLLLLEALEQRSLRRAPNDQGYRAENQSTSLSFHRQPERCLQSATQATSPPRVHRCLQFLFRVVACIT